MLEPFICPHCGYQTKRYRVVFKDEETVTTVCHNCGRNIQEVKSSIEKTANVQDNKVINYKKKQETQQTSVFDDLVVKPLEWAVRVIWKMVYVMFLVIVILIGLLILIKVC